MCKSLQNSKNPFKRKYQIIAEKFEVTERYVGKIARSYINPKRGKGLQVKKAIAELLKEETGN